MFRCLLLFDKYFEKNLFWVLFLGSFEFIKGSEVLVFDILLLIFNLSLLFGDLFLVLIKLGLSMVNILWVLSFLYKAS